jgi:CheY-like chemotaxis protein
VEIQASWTNRDEAWTDVARGLRATANDIRVRRQAQPPATRGTDIPAVDAPPSSTRGGPLLDRVTSDFTQRISQANASKGGATLDEADVRRQARCLIDLQESKHVLWVDDHPENNTGEAAALAKLQIEVTAVRSTDEALARLAEAGAGRERFDLIISDWSRSAEGPLAGLRLLVAMREHGHTQPLVFYHGTFDKAQRAALAASALAAGAFGEAVLPVALMGLVLQALDG